MELPPPRWLTLPARWLSVIGLALGLLACDSSAPPRRPHILLITVDTLRADHTSLYGYDRDTTPHLRAFFTESRLFERAYASEANTSPSVISILSGRLPQNHGVRLLYQKVDSDLRVLPDYLNEAGYRTAGIVSNTVLTDEAIGLADRFDHFDDFVDEREEGWGVFERVAARTTRAALSWLANQPAVEKPVFLWAHYIDPHGPYDPPHDASVDYVHETPLPIDLKRVHHGHHRFGLRDGLEYVDRYDEEIAYTDREVGRLLAGFEGLGFGDDAIILFTADHGETMMEFKRWFAHGYHVYEPIIRVPLAIRATGLAAERIATPVSLVGVLPTILDLAGLEIPAGLDGESLAGEVRSRPIFAEATFGKGRQWRTVIEGDRKWVAEVRADGQRGRRLHYPVEREARPSIGWNDDDPVGRQLLSLIESDPDPAGIPAHLEKGVAITAPKVAPGLDKATLERLKALGYVQ